MSEFYNPEAEIERLRSENAEIIEAGAQWLGMAERERDAMRAVVDAARALVNYAAPLKPLIDAVRALDERNGQ